MTNAGRNSIYVGTAGWSLPAALAAEFPEDGSHLSRYSRRLDAVEINSSFYRPHRTSTYARWAASVPARFRFAAKVPREITHRLRLVGTIAAVERFLAEVSGLGAKLGPLLVQLPPSLPFGAKVAQGFFTDLRGRFTGSVVCEPRHPTWFHPEAAALLSELQIARVAADPAVVPDAIHPGGWQGLAYYRLHGSPRIYYSDYSDEFLNRLWRQLVASSHRGPVWCIFDNTALGAATANGLRTSEYLKPG